MAELRWALVGASDVAATRMLPAMRRLGHDAVGVAGSDASGRGVDPVDVTALLASRPVPHLTTGRNRPR